MCDFGYHPFQFTKSFCILKKYPQNIEADAELLNELNCNLVFVPEISEIYPKKDNRKFDFKGLDSYMEGQFRPGHFNGVAQVVSRLFDIVAPDRAFFGEKDFQQLAIIKYLTKNILKLSKPEIIPCPILREKNGLAMSSRNERLTKEQRENAVVISKTIFEATKRQDKMTVDSLKKWVIDEINKNPFLEVEYFDIVDNDTLIPISEWSNINDTQGCIAVFANDIRLIDNVKFPILSNSGSSPIL